MLPQKRIKELVSGREGQGMSDQQIPRYDDHPIMASFLIRM
jgi:hypothetical protein